MFYFICCQMFFSFINLGCTKNLVDTQFLLGRILERWSDQFFYDVDPFSEEVELVFLNTCGFISSGRNEMFQTIKKLLRKRKSLSPWLCGCLFWESCRFPSAYGSGNWGMGESEKSSWFVFPFLGRFCEIWTELSFQFRAKVSAKAFTRVNVSATRECESIYESWPWIWISQDRWGL